MRSKVLLFLAILKVIACVDDFYKPPVYKYRYETEDVMKTAASNLPVHGYHVVEGGYYPYELHHGGVGVGTAALHGGISGPGIGGAFSGPGFGGALTGPGIGGLNGQYLLKPVGLIGAGGYGGAEFGGAGIGFGGI